MQPTTRDSNHRFPLVTTLLWLLYFLVPSEGSIVDGLPLGRLETIGVCLVLWIAAHRVRIGGARTALALAIAGTIAAAAVPGDRGFSARYFSTASASGTHERSTEFQDAAFTRVDARLDFTNGDRDFPLAFFNDHSRFNFMRMGEPNRRYLEFAAVWTGWLHVPGNGPRTYYLEAPQASAQLSIDAATILTSDPKTPAQARELSLPEGWHRIHVAFSSPYGGPREFSAGEIRGEARMPFDVSHARTEQIDKRQMILSRLFGAIKDAADLLALGWLATLAFLLVLRRAGEIWHRRIPIQGPVLVLFAAVATAEALRFAWPWAERLRILTGGDDTMIYEGYARDILFNGILMNGGLPLGQGDPFYFQASYPYFLAWTHALFGESVFGAIFLQRLLVALTALVITRIATLLAGQRVWPTALVVASAFLYRKLAPISADLLNESLYVPLLMAWALLCITLGTTQTVRSAVLTGITGGLAALTRSTSTLSWPLVWIALFVRLRQSPARVTIMTLVVAASLAVFSLIAVRNAIVSDRFVPTPTGFSITLRGGNEPPGGLVIDPGNNKALYDRLGVDGNTAQVIEFALTAPGAFAANLGRKALFVLGFYEPYAPGWGYSPVYIVTWLSAVAGCWLLFRSGQEPISATIPLSIAVTQFVALVLVYPKGERLIVPIHALLIPYSAIAIDRIVRVLMRPASAGWGSTAMSSRAMEGPQTGASAKTSCREKPSPKRNESKVQNLLLPKIARNPQRQHASPSGAITRSGAAPALNRCHSRLIELHPA